MSQSTDPARHHERLLIVDFGSQVTQLIARRLRELNVYCEIHPFQNVTDAFLAEFAPKAVIFSGGPASVIDEGSPRPRRVCSSWACRSSASATASR
jgi:GMP synthase (glutamine-hydrolysing)